MNENKPRLYQNGTMLLILITAVALIVTIVTLVLKSPAATPVQGTPGKNHSSYYTPNDSSSQETADSLEKDSKSAGTNGEKEERYTITIYNGKIGVFKQGESEPFVISDISVYLLPQQDIDLLQKGISATGFSQVKAILEDYR